MKRLAPLAAVCALLACSTRKETSAPSNTMPDPAYHSAHFFPVSPGSVHGPPPGQPLATCNQCHADRSSGVPPYPPSPSFATFTCTGCHVEVQPGVFHDDVAGLAALGAHVGQAGFDPTQPLAFDQACLRCHPDGAGGTPPVYHSQLFPIDSASKHAGIGCSSCHGQVRADLTQMKCASCHADPMKSTPFPHSPVIGVNGTVAILVELTPPPASCTPVALPPLQSLDCLRCHALSHVDHVELTHPTGNTGFGNDIHSGAGCFTCHVATTQITATVTPPTPAPSGYPAADFTQPSPASQSSQGCATCHGFGCGGTGI
jgi:hypothetical protein